MRQGVEFILFTAVAAAAHLVVFQHAPNGAAPTFSTDSLPVVDTTVPPPSTSAVVASLRPEERPSRPTKPRSTPSAPAQTAPRQTAAGSGQNQTSGNEGAAAVPT